MKTSEEPYVKHLDTVVYPARKSTGVRPLLAFFSVLAILIAAGIVAGLLPRLRREKSLQATEQTETTQRLVVNVAAAKLASPKSTLDLPGDIQALIESPIFPRTDGYISKRNSEIGDIVKAGQVMAEIETPELDQQLQQAKATLSNSESTLKELEADITLAQANVNMAEITFQRWKILQAKGAIARQDFDERDADFQVKRATLEAAKARLVSARDTVAANEANVRRLEQTKSFAHVTAPFDGIVTYRVMDVGTLVNAGNGGANHEIFRVADISTMRIFVNVPQTWVSAIHDGQTAELRVQELPGQSFCGGGRSLDPRGGYHIALHVGHPSDAESRAPVIAGHVCAGPVRHFTSGIHAADSGRCSRERKARHEGRHSRAGRQGALQKRAGRRRFR